MSKSFSSPREEALEIAYQTRKAILASTSDPIAILRACLVIASDLSKSSMIEWVEQELSGYQNKEIPQYRVYSCPVYGGPFGNVQEGFRDFKLNYAVHYLYAYAKKHEDIPFTLKDGKTLYVSANRVNATLSSIVDKCFRFLNETITELQYGGVVEFLMEEIRRKTDEKLAACDARISEETQSLYLNLTSTNPADWSKVGHSCRKILKLLADSVFPPRNEKYNAKDGRTLEVNEPSYVNRLYAFLDKNLPSEEKKFVEAQIDYLESYLRQIVSYAQMAEHNPSIEKFHANMLAIHTYLIISDILRYVQEKAAS